MKVFKLLIDLDDETGLTFNALVDRPAHNKKLLAFDGKKKAVLQFNDSKRMITGVAISANQLLFRSDPQIGDHYVYFEPKEVEKMVLKMSRQQLLSSVNLMHDSKKVVNGITFIEGYFVTKSKRPPLDDQNIQDGSYVMTYYVEDDVLYNEIKNGRYVGYSVEGLFDQIPVKIKSNKKSNQMKKKSLFAIVFGKNPKAFAEATTVDGIVLSYEGDLGVGTAVFVTDGEGNQVAAPEGSHVLEDGRTLMVDANGIVTSITEATPVAEVPEEVTLEEVVSVLTAMNTKLEAVQKANKLLGARFTALQKGEVDPILKFNRTGGETPGWRKAASNVK